jgi:DNA polymerase-3 subunit alpha
MGKKIKKEMEAQRDAFIAGAMARGVSRPQATHVFDLVARFADYGFNKSHAAAYALVAYQTAYMKANHPVEFLAASMSFELANTDRLNAFREETERLGIRLLPPDVNRSEANVSVETGSPPSRGSGSRPWRRWWRSGGGAARSPISPTSPTGWTPRSSIAASSKV